MASDIATLLVTAGFPGGGTLSYVPAGRFEAILTLGVETEAGTGTGADALPGGVPKKKIVAATPAKNAKDAAK